MYQEIPLDKITIGPRFRQDLGDVSALAASIAAIGLLHPIIVTTDYALVVGRRRLAAHVELGLATIEARVIDLDDLFTAEVDENQERKDYAISELVAIGRAREQRDSDDAARRKAEGQKSGGRGKKKLAVDSTASFERDARDITATALGLGWQKYERAKCVVKAAEEDPEFQDLVERMDQTGNVTRAYHALPLDMRKTPATEEDTPPPRKPLKPISITTMQLKLDAVVQGIIMPRLAQLTPYEVEHVRTLLRFYLELIDKERAEFDATPDNR